MVTAFGIFISVVSVLVLLLGLGLCAVAGRYDDEANADLDE